jgi:hypothetical protein
VIYVPTVGLGLTRDAAASSWNRLPPGFRDLLAQSAPGAGDGVIDARIDLFLYGSIASPTNGHVLILPGKSLRSQFAPPGRASPDTVEALRGIRLSSPAATAVR